MRPLARAAIVAEARSWVGTPYRHQASAKGYGCDCLGLVRGVWRALIGPEPAAMPPYTPDWAERGEPELLLEAAHRFLIERPRGQAAPGDVLLFRMEDAAPAKHCAILTTDGRMVHAYWGRAAIESRYSDWWRMRAAGCFAFPGAQAWPS